MIVLVRHLHHLPSHGWILSSKTLTTLSEATTKVAKEARAKAESAFKASEETNGV